MSTLNKVLLIGNLTSDPEIRHTKSGKAVAQFRLAVNRRHSGADGERKEETTFLDVTAWDRLAELSEQFLNKGRSILIEGRLNQENWKDKQTGQNRSKIGVVAERLEFLGSPQGENAEQRKPAFA
jgi:single-strand DNA-binding protein